MISTILLQLGAGGGSPYGSFVMMGAIIVVFYFFMIRPQIKKQKDQKKFVDEMKKGDKVVTTAGIHGKVVEIADATILIEVDSDRNVKMRFDKSAVSLDSSKAISTPAKS
jgi:preprotein translocase subunit YajC